MVSVFVVLLSFLVVSADGVGQLKASSAIVVDLRTYRHCHNLPRRVECHTSDPYPPILKPNPTKRSPLLHFFEVNSLHERCPTKKRSGACIEK